MTRPSEWSDCLDAGCGKCDACRALEVAPRPSALSPNRRLLIEACTFAIDGHGLDAEVAVSVMSADERADLINALDDLRALVDRTEVKP